MYYLFSNNVSIYNSNNQSIANNSPLPVKFTGTSLDSFGRIRMRLPASLFTI